MSNIQPPKRILTENGLFFNEIPSSHQESIYPAQHLSIPQPTKNNFIQGQFSQPQTNFDYKTNEPPQHFAGSTNFTANVNYNETAMNQILLNSSVVIEQIYQLSEKKKEDKDFYQLLRYEARQIEY